MKTYPCFGLEFLGQCNYNPTNPIVYFSIGQLLSLIIITIAVYKILNPIIRLRIRASKLFKFKPNFFGLRNWINKWEFPSPFQPLAFFLKNAIIRIEFNIFYYLVIFSIIAVFLSSIIPSIPNFYKTPVIGYPIFWEMLSGLIFAYLGIHFIKIINKPAQFNRHNYKEFFDSCLPIIDRREEKELILLARELTHSLETIIDIVKNYENLYFHVQNLARKKYAPNESSVPLYKLYQSGLNFEVQSVIPAKAGIQIKPQNSNTIGINQFIQKDKDLQKMIQLNEIQDYCFQILELLSDKIFCKIVACKVPEFSEIIFSLTSLNSYICPEQRKIFGNILQSSFKNEDSILNRENQHDGLKNVSNLTSLIFENHRLLQQSSFISIISWIDRIKFTKEWQIKLYFSCLKVALQFSFDVECHQTLRHIHEGFLKITDILDDILVSDFSLEKKTHLLNTVRFEIDVIMYFVNENKDKITPYSSNSPFLFPIGFHSDSRNTHQVSLYHVLAKSLLDLFVCLSKIDTNNSNKQFFIRHIGVTLLRNLTLYNKETGKILIDYLKFHISEENFKKRLYPPLTKYMILFFGLYYPQKIENEWDSLQTYLLDKLKKEFHSLYITEKEFALNLLPFSVSYDPVKKIITQTIDSRSEKERILQCE